MSRHGDDDESAGEDICNVWPRSASSLAELVVGPRGEGCVEQVPHAGFGGAVSG